MTSKRREEEIILAFHLMWDRYPEQVRLIDRHYRVAAGNPAYIRAGGQTEVQCNVGPAEMHKGCQAMSALNSGETKSDRHQAGEACFESFWIPVAKEGEYYVHFTNGLNDAIRRMTEQAAQQKEQA
jgi:hypothetical protein